MAAAYIDKGPAEGNKLMKQFDPFAAMITTATDVFVTSQINELNDNMEQIQVTINADKNRTLLVNTVILLLMLTIVFAITRGIKKSIIKVFDFTTRLGKGDFTSSLEIRSRDEIGIIADRLSQMKMRVSKMLEEIIKGNKTLQSSSVHLAQIAEHMNKGAVQTSDNANTVAAATEQMSVNMSSVAADTEQASANLSTITLATEEMTNTISEIAQNSAKTLTITQKAVYSSKSAAENVNELGQSAQMIWEVVETITDISEQTNLLALNATIEGGQASTGKTVTQIDEIVETINDINNMMATISAAAEEQSVTTKEITENVGQASQGVQDITQNVTQTSQAAEQIAHDIAGINQDANQLLDHSHHVNAKSDDLRQIARQMDRMTGKFKIQQTGGETSE